MTKDYYNAYPETYKRSDALDRKVDHITNEIQRLLTEAAELKIDKEILDNLDLEVKE